MQRSVLWFSIFLCSLYFDSGDVCASEINSKSHSQECAWLSETGFSVNDLLSFLEKTSPGEALVRQFKNTLKKTHALLDIRYINTLTKQEKGLLLESGRDPDQLLGAYLVPGVIKNKDSIFLLRSGMSFLDSALVLAHEIQHKINEAQEWNIGLSQESARIQTVLFQKSGDFRKLQSSKDVQFLQSSLGLEGIRFFIDEYSAYAMENKIRSALSEFFNCGEDVINKNSDFHYVFDLNHSAEDRAQLFQLYVSNKTKEQVNRAIEWIENSVELRSYIAQSQVSLEQLKEIVSQFKGFEPKTTYF